MKTYNSKTLFALILVLFTSISVSAIQNPTEKKLVEAKEEKAITLDEQGHIIVEVAKLKNEMTTYVIDQKIDNGQASLLGVGQIEIKPIFPYDCNTFTLLWLLEKQNSAIVTMPNLEEASKETKPSSEK